MTQRTFFFLTIIFLLHRLQSYGQTKTLSIDYYSNGKLFWKGYDTCFSYSYRGEETQTCYPIGLWEYWYQNGKKQLQTFNDKAYKDSDSVLCFTPTKYVNMWLQDGRQVLNNGKGFYYEIEGDKNDYGDSLVFQITDSIKLGKFNRYRSYKNSPYFLIEFGQLDKYGQTGIWKFRDSILGICEQSHYVKDKKNGMSQTFYPSGKLKKEGQYINSIKDGLWKYYDESGKLVKECNFVAGRQFGDYKEYYANGKLKVVGQFTFIKGKEIVRVEKVETGEVYERKEFSDKIEAMDGIWKFYDETGRLYKTKYYKKKVSNKYICD